MPPGPTGRGDKFDAVDLLLRNAQRVGVEAWIRRRRKQPDSSYYTLARELSAMLRNEFGDRAPRVTYETVRRWDPDGSFQTRTRTEAQPDEQPAED